MSRRLALLPVALAAQMWAQVPAGAAEQPLWELGGGLAALSLPHYRGSDQTRQWLLPVPWAVYRGRIFRADRDGARAVLLDGQTLEFDLSTAAAAPAPSAGNRAREGMPDLKPQFEFGPNLNWHLARGAHWKLDLRLPVRAAFTLGDGVHHAGWVAAPSLNLDLQWQGWNLGLVGSRLWGDRRIHRLTYEVAPAYATAERPAWQAHGGAAGWQATVGASRRFGAHWLGVFYRHDSVAGATFASSPLVRQHDNHLLGIAWAWVWASSTDTVNLPD